MADKNKSSPPGIENVRMETIDKVLSFIMLFIKEGRSECLMCSLS